MEVAREKKKQITKQQNKMNSCQKTFLHFERFILNIQYEE